MKMRPSAPTENPSPANLSHKISHLIDWNDGLPMVDENKVISATTHLHERNSHQNISFPSLTELAENSETEILLLLLRDLCGLCEEPVFL